MPWTLFWDMYSGGSRKEPPYNLIFIEACEDEACRVFQARFGHNPHRVTCTCCGSDYAVREYETLDEATEYHRTEFRSCSLEEFMTSEHVKIINALDITDEERSTALRRQGYVWMEE